VTRPDVVNIGPRGRRRRAGLGVLMLVLGAGVIVLRPQPASLLLALPSFFIGMLGILQAREGT
jgi:hypothetical protein